MATLTDPNGVSSETYSDLASRKIPFLTTMTSNMLFDIKGDLSVGKTVYFGENFTFGDAVTDTLTMTGTITFSADTRTVGIDFADNCTTAIDIGTATTGIAVTGACTDGISVTSACTDAIHVSGSVTGNCFNVTGSPARAIMIGTKDTGIPISTSGYPIDTDPNNYMMGIFSVVSAAEATSSDELRGAWIRTRVSNACTIGTATGWGYGVCGAEIQLKIYGATINSWQASAVWAQLESQGSTTTIADGCVASAVLARPSLQATTTIASGGVLAGVTIDACAGSTITTTGGYYGLYVYQDNASALDFDAAIYIDSGTCDYAIDIKDGVIRMGVQETGIDLTTDYPFGVEVQTEANADIVAGSTGSSAGIYSRYAIEYDQTSQCNHIAVFGKLRVKQDLADGNHCGVYGLIELSGTTQLGGTSTTQTSAGFFALDCGSSMNLSTGWLNGVLIDSSIATGATTTGTTCAIQTKVSASCDDFDYGIYMGGVTTGIYLNGVGATTEHFLDMIDGYLGLVIETGTYATTADSGVTITSTGNPRPVSFLFDDSGTTLGGNVEITPVLGRYLATVDHTTAECRLSVIQGHIQANSGVDFSGDTSEYYACQGILECAGATAIGTNSWAAGVCGMIWADGNFTGSANDTYGCTAGVMAKLYQTSGSTATTAGMAVTTWWNSADTWDYGFYVHTGSVTTGYDIRLQQGAVIGAGTGVPSHSAVQGSLYIRTAQAQNATLYMNTDGGTTWTLCDSLH